MATITLTICALSLTAASASANTISLTVANATGTGQALTPFSAFNGVQQVSSVQQPAAIADGTQQPVSAMIGAGIPLGLTQYLVWRLGNTSSFFVVLAQFGGGNDGDLACGWTDANAGWDGENFNAWTPENGCSVNQTPSGSDSITGAITANAPTSSPNYPSCWEGDAPWREASDTGLQPVINNSTGQQLNLVQGQLSQSQGNYSGGFFPPPNYPDALLAGPGGSGLLHADVLGPQSTSLSIDTWQYPPDAVIPVGSTTSTFCAYDSTTALDGGNLGTYMTVTYEIGNTGEYLVMSPSDPIVGSNQFSTAPSSDGTAQQGTCAITDSNGNIDYNNGYGVDCGINENGGLLGTWHATAWVTVFN